ncbi:hypothetical protein ACHAXT_000419 [Thalassiosira profunda]
MCCGLIAWQWRREKGDDAPVSDRDPYFNGEDESRGLSGMPKPAAKQKHAMNESLSYSQLEAGSLSNPSIGIESDGQDPSSSNFIISSLGMDPSVGHDISPADPSNANESGRIQTKRPDPVQSLQPDDEDGYDGGKESSFLRSSDNVEDESSDEGAEMNDSDEGNVLGLLYYDGASSAGESDAKESWRSRRSRRSRRSGKSSKSHKSRRNTPIPPLNAVAEESGSKRPQQQMEPEGLHESGQGEHSGRVVYANAEMEDDGDVREKNTYRHGNYSFFSHGSTIRTDDSHRKAYTE